MAASFAVGARVDGLYDGNSDDVWYPGVVHAAHEDATFDVLYDDGEAEYHVLPQYLRAHKRGTICVGTRVFGRYAAGDEWYPGKIQEVLEDGTFTLEYDDGEVEAGLSVERIRESMTDDVEEITPVDGEEAATTGGDVEVEAEVQVAQDKEQAEEEAEADADQEEPASVHEELHQESAAQVEMAEDPPIAVNEDRSYPVKEAEAASVALPDVPVYPVPTYQENQQEPSQQEAPARRKSRSKAHSPPVEASVEPAHTVVENAQSVDEYANILSTIEQLESSFADALTTKTLLSTLVKQMRAFPQATADLVHMRSGEALLIDILKRHHTHAVIQCYGFVLLRRLCFLCGKSTHYFLRNGIIELVTIAMRKFAEDAILQASACGALAVFTRVHAGLTALLENRVSHLVLATIIFHKTYSVHTRQVHYYACEVLLELCELGDKTTIEALCGDSMSGPGLSDLSPVSLLLFLLRQALSFDDKKACCAVGTLLMCLASCHRHAAQMVLDLNGLSELSTVMAKYPMEPGIQKYAASASKEIALSSMEQPSPTQRRVQNAAHDLLGESSSMEDLQQHRLQQHRQGAKGKTKGNSSTGTSKRKPPQQHGHGVRHLNGFPSPSDQQHLGAMAGNSKDALSFSKYTSPIGKAPHLPPNIRSFNGSAPSPSAAAYQQLQSQQLQQQQQQQYPQRNQVSSPLVILDGLGHAGTEKKKFMKEERHNLLFETYGVDAKSALHQPQAGDHHHVRTLGIKRRQLKTHIVAATGVDGGGVISWASPVKAVILKDDKMLSSRSDKHSAKTATSTAAANDTRKTRSSGGQLGTASSQGDLEAEELSPATRRRQQLQEKARETKKRDQDGDERTPRSSSFRLKLDGGNTPAGTGAVGMVSPIAVSPKSGRGTTKSTTKTKKTGRQAAPPSSRLSGGEKNPSNESLNSYATQLFKEEMQAPAASPSTNAAAIKAAQERERLSFAEKLHKMIDKAKSSLAHGSTVSLAAESPVKVSSKRPNNGNSASVKEKHVPTATVTTSRVAPASTKPAVSVSTPSKEATTQKRPMAATIKPAPPKKPVAVAAKKPTTPASKPITPVPPKSTKADTATPSRPAPVTTKSGSASVRLKPVSTSAKPPAATNKAEKKADNKNAADSAAAVMAAVAVVTAASTVAVVLAVEEKDSEPTSSAAETKADSEDVPSSEAVVSVEQSDESAAVEGEVEQKETQQPVDGPHAVVSTDAVAENLAPSKVEDASSTAEPDSSHLSEEPVATEEEASVPVENEKNPDEAVAEAAAVAASAADDLYADEYNDFDDLDGGDNAPQTLDDDPALMGRDTSFEALMKLTAQVTNRQEDESGIPQFSVAAPAPTVAVEEPEASTAEAAPTDTEGAEDDGKPASRDGVDESNPAVEENPSETQETAVAESDPVEPKLVVETADAAAGEAAEMEPATSGKYDHAEDVTGGEQDEPEQAQDPASSESGEPTPAGSPEIESAAPEEAEPVAATEDEASTPDEPGDDEAVSNPTSSVEEATEAKEATERQPTEETECEERPESRQTDASYGEEDFEDTPEDAGDVALPDAAEDEAPMAFEPVEAPTFELATDEAPPSEALPEPAPADEPAVDQAMYETNSGEEAASNAIELHEPVPTSEELSSPEVDAVEAEDSAEVIEPAAEVDMTGVDEAADATDAIAAADGDAAAYEDKSFSNLDASVAKEETSAAPEPALELPVAENNEKAVVEEPEAGESSAVVEETVAIGDEASPEKVGAEQEPDPTPASQPEPALANQNAEDTSDPEEATAVSNDPPAAEQDKDESLQTTENGDESSAPEATIEMVSEEPRVATPDVYGDAEFATDDAADAPDGELADADRDLELSAPADQPLEQPPVEAAPNEEDRATTPDMYSEGEFAGDESVSVEKENVVEETDPAETPVTLHGEKEASLGDESVPSTADNVGGSEEASDEAQLEEPEVVSESAATSDAYDNDEEFEVEPPVNEASDVNESQVSSEPDEGVPSVDEPVSDAPQKDHVTEPDTTSTEESPEVAVVSDESARDDGEIESLSQPNDDVAVPGEADVPNADAVPAVDESTISSSSEDQAAVHADEDTHPTLEQANEHAPEEEQASQDRAATPDAYGDTEFAEEDVSARLEEATADDGVVELPHEDHANEDVDASVADDPESTEPQAVAAEADVPTSCASSPEGYGDDADFEEEAAAQPTKELEVNDDAGEAQVDAVEFPDAPEAQAEVAESADGAKTDDKPAELDAAQVKPEAVQAESEAVEAESEAVEGESEAVGAVDSSAALEESTSGDAETPPQDASPAAPEGREPSTELTPPEPLAVNHGEDAAVEVRPSTPEEDNLYENDTAFGDEGDSSEPPQPAAESLEPTEDELTPQEADSLSPTVEADEARETVATAAEETTENHDSAPEAEADMAVEPSVDEQPTEAVEPPPEQEKEAPAHTLEPSSLVEATESPEEPQIEATEPSVEAVPVEVAEPPVDALLAEAELPPIPNVETSEVTADQEQEQAPDTVTAREAANENEYADENAFDEEAVVDPATPATDEMEFPTTPRAIENAAPAEEVVVPAAEEIPSPAQEAEVAARQVEDHSEEVQAMDTPTEALHEEPASEATPHEDPVVEVADKVEDAEAGAAVVEATEEVEAVAVEDAAAEETAEAATDPVDGVTVSSPDEEVAAENTAETQGESGSSEPQASNDEVGQQLQSEEFASPVVEAEKIEEVANDEVVENELAAEELPSEPGSVAVVDAAQEPPAISPEEESKEAPKSEDAADEYAFDEDPPADEATPQEDESQTTKKAHDAESSEEKPLNAVVVDTTAAVVDKVDDTMYNDDESEFDELKMEAIVSTEPSPISSSAPSPPASDEIDYEDFERDEPVAAPAEPVEVEKNSTVSEPTTDAVEEPYADETEDYNDFEDDAATETASAPVAAAPAPATSVKKEEDDVEDAYEAEEGFEGDEHDAKTTSPPRIQPSAAAAASATMKPPVAAASAPTTEEDADNDYEAEYDEFED